MAVVYGREYGDKVLSFEASGGLSEATLVMRDRETDSWWSIMSGDAIGGDMKGEKLIELPVGEKVQWGEWKERYPLTMVLSVDGAEHDSVSAYEDYLTSERMFRDTKSKDERMPGKEPIFAFRIGSVAYAVRHSVIVNETRFEVGGGVVVLSRPEGAHVLQSTRATHVPASGDPQPLIGFDTFWYGWSNINDNVMILE